MMAMQKAIVVSIGKTDLSMVVLARAGESKNSHYFSTADLTKAIGLLTNEHLEVLSKQQGRQIVADSSQLTNYYTNLTHHFMSFCANPMEHTTSVFEGFNEQHGSAIILTVTLKRADVMDSNTAEAGK